MALTYTSCYKVSVPPLDLHSSERHSGVRMRGECEPLDQLRDFRVLYLPKQLYAEAKEAEQAAAMAREEAQDWAPAASSLSGSPQPPPPPPPREFEMFLSNDALLNGSLASKGRHAIRSEFAPLRGPDGSTVFGVRFQRGGGANKRALARKNAGAAAAAAMGLAIEGGSASSSAASTAAAHSAAAAAAAALSMAADESLDGTRGGMPYWMRTEGLHASLPRSTTHATFRALPEDSFLLDQKHFHAYYDERAAPPTPMLQQQSNYSSPYSAVTPAHHAQRLKKVPLTSSDNASLFFRVPDSKPYPLMFRNSNLLRQEARNQREVAATATAAAATAEIAAAMAAAVANMAAADLAEQQQQQQQQRRSSQQYQQHQGSSTERISRSGRGARNLQRFSTPGTTLAVSTPTPPLQHPRETNAPTSQFAATTPAVLPVPSSSVAQSGSFSARDRATLPPPTADSPPPPPPRSSPATLPPLPTFREHMQRARERWRNEEAQQ